MDIAKYFWTRKISVVLTVIILLLGTIAYFATDVAERNNRLMYDKLYASSPLEGLTADVMSDGSTPDPDINPDVNIASAREKQAVDLKRRGLV